MDKFSDFPFVDFKKHLDYVDGIYRDVFLANGSEAPTPSDQLVLLYELTKRLHGLPEYGYILDLGTNCGVSAGIMAVGSKESDRPRYPIFTSDNYKHYYAGSPEMGHHTDFEKLNDRFKVARKNFFQLGVIDNIYQIICDDAISLPFWNLPLRLVFFDSLHDYDIVTNQINVLLPFLQPLGWLVFHDYVDEPWSGVIPAVNEFIESQSSDAIRVFSYEAVVAIQKLT